mmetsp:Transcript_15351/g.25572  ORF Transcript_15351/g.25572 Transcript_15351/m.25572 type:complete len:302 (+) Transcript_15351:82-987(+)
MKKLHLILLAVLLTSCQALSAHGHTCRPLRLTQLRAATESAPTSECGMSPSRKPILVIGATGRLGSAIVQKLSSRNIPYRCLVRPKSPNFERIQGLSGGQIFEGDLANPQHVEAAVSSGGGISGCICVSGSFRKTKMSDVLLPWRWSNNKKGKDTTHPYIVNHIGMQNLCKSVDDYNQCHEKIKIVKVSGVMLSLPRWHHINILGNMIYSGVLRWHRAGERDIIDSGVPCTILRPGSFRDDKEYGHLKKGMQIVEDGALKPSLRVKKPLIGKDDLTEICIDCLKFQDDIDGRILYPRWILK